MYLQDYLWFLVALGVCLVLSAIASARVRRAYSKYSSVRVRSGLTGYATALRLLSSGGVHGVSVGRVSGNLTDHYSPNDGVVNLSDSTYGSSSVAAVAVAAHEIGHVMQREQGSLMYRLRTALVPAVNIGSRLAMPLVLVGLLIDMLLVTVNEGLGFYIAMIGVILYGSSLLFALVTLPVELDASRRAREMLVADGILTRDEMPGANKVLSAAAMTYLASLLTSLVYFLRFLLYVLTVFGRRNNR